MQRHQTVASSGRDDRFWKKHGGVGLVWSNPAASDEVMIFKALLAPNFHLLLDIALRFGLARLQAQWRDLQASIHENGYPEELAQLHRAQPIVERCLKHMEQGARGR